MTAAIDRIELPGWTHVYSGKVRDLYEPAPDSGTDPALVLVVASDRISAYDHILPTPIPDKGAVLTALSLWWFETLGVAHHVVSTDVPAAVAGRAMVCRRLAMYPVECVARGYLAGSGLVEYREDGQVCGVPLPPGLVEGSKLPQPIFTPATKADLGEHDENVTFEKAAAIVGEEAAGRLRDLTLQLYVRAAEIAVGRGIILADTKFEFGRVPGTEEIVLGDEVLTPDSSRYWPAESWQPGRAQPSFDKQFVRDWLTSPASGWDRRGELPPPPLPPDVVERAGELVPAAAGVPGVGLLGSDLERLGGVDLSRRLRRGGAADRDAARGDEVTGMLARPRQAPPDQLGVQPCAPCH